MRADVNTPRRGRPWGPALLGSATVALALCIVAWSVSDPVAATIASIAVVTIAALAVWSGRPRACSDRARVRREERS